MASTYTAVHQVPVTVQRVQDAEDGTWRRMDNSDYFMPEFAGGNMTLAEVIDLFGPVTDLGINAEH
jgi:hypothetical protein